MLDQLKRNLEFDHWANLEMLKALEGMANPPEKAVNIFGHILFAKDVWLARLLREDLSRFKDPWPPSNLGEFKSKLEELREKWSAYLKGLKPGDLEEKLVYPNTQGKRFEQVVRNIIVQVGYHGHYHRGQLASLIHGGEGKRPNTDYIGYVFGIGEAREIKD